MKILKHKYKLNVNGRRENRRFVFNAVLTVDGTKSEIFISTNNPLKYVWHRLRSLGTIRKMRAYVYEDGRGTRRG